METVPFLEAVRRLIVDAPSNFVQFRGRNRDPESLVITDFDGSFAVEGIADACVALLDYDVPRAKLHVYEGSNAAAASEAYETYVERVAEFSGHRGERTEFTHRFSGTPPHLSDLKYAPPSSTRWIESRWPTGNGGSIRVTWASDVERADDRTRHHVVVEVPGRTLECLDGTPETSPWRIMLGDDTAGQS